MMAAGTGAWVGMTVVVAMVMLVVAGTMAIVGVAWVVTVMMIAAVTVTILS